MILRHKKPKVKAPAKKVLWKIGNFPRCTQPTN